MAVTKNIWDWTWFTWLADNSYISQKWQYSNWSINIDNQTEPWWAKLTPALLELYTTDEEPSHILNLEDFWGSWIYVFCEKWVIYKNWELHYTLDSWDNILWATAAYQIPNKDYPDESELFIFIFTKNAVHRMDLKDPVGVDEDYRTFIEDNNTKKCPVTVYWEIYFISKYIFYRIDKQWTLNIIYRFWIQERLSWLTFFQDNFNVYTTTWWQWRQYIFPILSETPYYNIEWTWLPILWVTNLWATDYVITWYNLNYSDLYLVSWTQRQILKANTEWSWSRWFNWIIHSRLDDIYIAWEYDWIDNIYKYWNYYPWFSQELTNLIWWWTERFTCFGSSQSALYVWTNANKVYIVALNTNAWAIHWYQTSWELISMMMDFWTPESKKSLKEVQITYDNTNTDNSSRWWTITVYARQWQKHTWKLIKTTWSKSDTWVIKVTASELAWLDNPIWDFYQIQFKAVLEWWSTTPFLKKVRVIYQDNLQA